MKEVKMKRPDLTDEKYAEQKLIRDQALLEYICDVNEYVDKLELALYKKTEELNELKENSLCKNIEEYGLSCKNPFGDPLDD